MSRGKGRKKVFYSKAAVTQVERVKWAYARWLSARARAQRHPDDRVLALAADSRRREWVDEKHALASLTERHARDSGQDGHEAGERATGTNG